MDNAILQAKMLGQSVWYDNIRRGLLASGELDKLVRKGVTGVTSNPTIFERAVIESTDYDEALGELIAAGKLAPEIFEILSIEDIQGAADVLRGVYDHTGRVDGYASYELPPHLSHDTEGSIREGRRLFAALGRPNVMIKVPATPEGVPVVRQLISEGINVNVTLIFALDSHEQVMDAYLGGLEEFVSGGGDPSGVASVASFFVSRVDTAVDELLRGLTASGSDNASALLGKAAVANAQFAYAHFREVFSSERFKALAARGARVQRPLWASTSAKDPSFPDTVYFDELIGPDTVNTMPDATVEAVLDHGDATARLNGEAAGAQATLTALAKAGVDMQAVTAKLLADGVAAFGKSYDAVLASIKEKSTLIADLPVTSLAQQAAAMSRGLKRVDDARVAERIWAHDHTLWDPDPTEITDRLGWLRLADTMRKQLGSLESFADEVRSGGYRHAVLLAMGGSAFAPELYRSVFGSADGCPEFIMLDSTQPGWVQRVTDAIDPAHTIFFVSSKSGGTVEVTSFYRHFRAKVDEVLGREAAGANFVAITDPGTRLEGMARDEGFGWVFLNPSDIGGRFSGLSLFGLVPAAAMGMDVSQFLDAVDVMRARCEAPSTSENPGAWLGGVIAGLAEDGIDKVEIVTSPSVTSMGLWTEQLIAESLGKSGKGVIPIAGEPPVQPSAYHDDRLFVYIRLAGDDNAAADRHMKALADAGKPVVRLDLDDRYNLGGELYRWEFATVTVGALIGVHVFNQPNVQAAKDIAQAALQAYERDGALPPPDDTLSVDELLATIKPGDYLSLQMYLVQTPELDAAVERVRRATVERFGIAAAAGYGPRYLHSTGQLHKAGPNTGVFIQLVCTSDESLPVPGTSYSFRVLADAQADGDLRALLSQDRRVARVVVGNDPAKTMNDLASQIANCE